jgi:hypothetical protein
MRIYQYLLMKIDINIWIYLLLMNNFKFNVRPNETIENVDLTIKTAIINFIYDKIDLGDYKFSIIKNTADIFDLKNNKYYVTANYGGMTFLLVFIKIKDLYYSYLVDRRTLSFSKHKLNIHAVKMIKVVLTCDYLLYDGSIFDCCIIDPLYDNKKQVIILDTFYLCGKNFLTSNYLKKMLFVNQYLKDNLEVNDRNNIIIHIAPTFELSQINLLFTDYIKENFKNLNIKGIGFYPNVSRNKLIYVFNKDDAIYKDKLLENKNYLKNSNTETKKENNKIDDENTELDKCISFELADIENTEDIILNFEIAKTSIIDVYKLYGIFEEDGNYYKKKIGIAYIPSYEISVKLRLLFEYDDKMIVSCKFNTMKKKWIPIEKAFIEKINVVNRDPRIKVIQ